MNLLKKFVNPWEKKSGPFNSLSTDTTVLDSSVLDGNVLSNLQNNQQRTDLSVENEKFIKNIKKYLSGNKVNIESSIAKAESEIQKTFGDGSYLSTKYGNAYNGLSDVEREAISKDEYIQMRIDHWFKGERDARSIPELKAQLEKVNILFTFYNEYEHFSDNSLTLGSVIRNEAGHSSVSAKLAVGYAYLNKIGSHVREPEGREISHYLKLSKRWDTFGSASKYEFLLALRPSIVFAVSILADKNRSKNDPTQGATHWISPDAPIFDSPNGDNTHKRIINGRVRYVPEWARSNDDEDLENLKGRNGILLENFKEIKIIGADDFLFFRGVR